MGIVKDHMYRAGAGAKVAIQGTAVALASTSNLITKQLGTEANAEISSASGVWITVLDYPIYYTLHGVDPATDGSVGDILNVNDRLELKNWHNIQQLRMIRQGSQNANVWVTAFFNEAAGWT